MHVRIHARKENMWSLATQPFSVYSLICDRYPCLTLSLGLKCPNVTYYLENSYAYLKTPKCI